MEDQSPISNLQQRPAQAPRRTARQQSAAAASAKGIVAELRGGDAARVEVVTAAGRLAFSLGELKSAGRVSFLDGSARAEVVPTHRQITDSPMDEDFPASAQAPDGTVWCACVAYRHGPPIQMAEVRAGRFASLVPQGNGDQLLLLRFDGQAWSAPLEVTPGGLDLWRPTVAVDGQGRVWAIWSQNAAGNWDLYARAYDPKSAAFSPIRRLTSSPGPDINPVAISLPNAQRPTPNAVYIAWQSWREDNFDILLAPLPERGELRPLTVSTSPANDWSPALGATSNGDLWIAWDTYDQGNYDVLARRFAGGRLGPVVPVATSERFEARPSLAVDRQDRVWIAFEDADPNWGKDSGTRWPGKSGVPFYLERHVRVRCLAGGPLQETAAPVESQAINTPPEGPRQRLSLPRLAVDAAGRLWLLFRRHPLPGGAGERWISLATYYDGERWSPQVQLPQSENLLDNRPTLVPLKTGELLAVYSSDRRTLDTRSAQDNNLYAALLTADAAPKPPALVAASARGDGKPVEPVHPDEARDVQRVRAYRLRAGGRQYRLLRGDWHRHSEISSHRDQDGPFEEVWRYGLDVARMDWLGPTDHDNGVDNEYTWWLTQKQMEIYHQPPVFIPMFTYERSVAYPSGHRNVMFARRGVRPLPRLALPARLMGTPEGGSPDVKNLYAYLKEFGGICASHTSATNMGTDWRDNDPDLEPVVEIYQGDRQNYEEPNAPMAANGPGDSVGGYQPAGYVWNAFAKGYRLGFEVSSDHVSTHLSYAVALVEQPTRAAILDAFRRRHTYGANDNIVLDVRCGDHVMGDQFTQKSLPSLAIHVEGTARIARLDIVRQVDRAVPTYVYAGKPGQRTVSLTWTDQAAQPGAVNMYYVRIQQEDGKLAWASPLWIRYQP
jgi:hypothetical protein